MEIPFETRRDKVERVLRQAEAELNFYWGQDESDDYDCDNIASLRDLLDEACRLLQGEYPDLKFEPLTEYADSEDEGEEEEEDDE